VAVDLSKSTGLLQAAVETFEQGMFYFDFISTQTTDDVVMVLPRDLISEMSIAGMGGTYQPILGQELQCPVYGRLGEAGQIAPGFPENLPGGDMRACMMEDMQDRHPLGCHSEAA
jgi:hypothetical protein